MSKPRILLVDDDPVLQKLVTAILENLNREGITLLIVTHDNAMGDRAQRHIRMVDGAIASDHILEQKVEPGVERHAAD